MRCESKLLLDKIKEDPKLSITNKNLFQIGNKIDRILFYYSNPKIKAPRLTKEGLDLFQKFFRYYKIKLSAYQLLSGHLLFFNKNFHQMFYIDRWHLILFDKRDAFDIIMMRCDIKKFIEMRKLAKTFDKPS